MNTPAEWFGGDNQMETIMTQINVTREFAHRTHGAIGKVVMTGEAAFKIDGKDLPDTSVEYLVNFALQSLQDAYAGSANQAEAQAAFAAKLKNIVDGTIGQRSSGGGVSEFTKVARSIVKKLLAGNDTGKAKLATFADMKDAEVNAALDEIYEKNSAKLEAAVKAEVKRREDERKAKAKLTNSLEIEL